MELLSAVAFLAVIVCAVVTALASSDRESMTEQSLRFSQYLRNLRLKRDASQFTQLVIKHLAVAEPSLIKRTAMSSSYLFYGNYCGRGGAGNCVDATDDCCFVHDNCYGEKKHLCTQHPLLQYYHLDWSWNCNDAKNNECQKAICKCDEDVAKCIGNNRKTFDFKFVGDSSPRFAKFSPHKPRTEPMFPTDRRCPGNAAPGSVGGSGAPDAAAEEDYDFKEFSKEEPPEHPEDKSDEQSQ